MATEYYVASIYFNAATRIASADRQFFCIAKFEGGSEPEAVYFVRWDKRTDKMYCDCPNQRRGHHVDDKHGKHIRKWLAAGEPTNPIPMDGPQRSPHKFSGGFTDPDDIPF